MRRTRQPSREAQLSPDGLTAYERSNDPARVRVYDRDSELSTWRPGGTIDATDAPKWYKVSRDTSD